MTKPFLPERGRGTGHLCGVRVLLLVLPRLSSLSVFEVAVVVKVVFVDFVFVVFVVSVVKGLSASLRQPSPARLRRAARVVLYPLDGRPGFFIYIVESKKKKKKKKKKKSVSFSEKNKIFCWKKTTTKNEKNGKKLTCCFPERHRWNRPNPPSIPTSTTTRHPPEVHRPQHRPVPATAVPHGDLPRRVPPAAPAASRNELLVRRALPQLLPRGDDAPAHARGGGLVDLEAGRRGGAGGGGLGGGGASERGRERRRRERGGTGKKKGLLVLEEAKRCSEAPRSLLLLLMSSSS